MCGLMEQNVNVQRVRDPLLDLSVWFDKIIHLAQTIRISYLNWSCQLILSLYSCLCVSLADREIVGLLFQYESEARLWFTCILCKSHHSLAFVSEQIKITINYPVIVWMAQTRYTQWRTWHPKYLHNIEQHHTITLTPCTLTRTNGLSPNQLLHLKGVFHQENIYSHKRQKPIQRSRQFNTWCWHSHQQSCDDNWSLQQKRYILYYTLKCSPWGVTSFYKCYIKQQSQHWGVLQWEG